MVATLAGLDPAQTHAMRAQNESTVVCLSTLGRLAAAWRLSYRALKGVRRCAHPDGRRDGVVAIGPLRLCPRQLILYIRVGGICMQRQDTDMHVILYTHNAFVHTPMSPSPPDLKQQAENMQW